jgi:2-polyprenyl-3-methyl-5-hydroxy-6-metoxy-1,4-benzoquinol methylase
MKNSWNLGVPLPPPLERAVVYDRMEIDARRWYSYVRLSYVDRIEKVISIVKESFPAPAQTRVGEFGCAQANMSLLLAEAGYETFAIDIDSDFIEYSKLKYEKGNIHWLLANIDNLALEPDFLDAAILGEVITLWAYPEKLLEKVLRFVRPGGLMIVTTPNGSRLRLRYAKFPRQIASPARRQLEARQFGMHHLFKLTVGAFRTLLPPGAVLEEWGYCGSTLLVNKYTERLLAPFPETFVRAAARGSARWPILNRLTSNTLYFVLRKQGPAADTPPGTDPLTAIPRGH